MNRNNDETDRAVFTVTVTSDKTGVDVVFKGEVNISTLLILLQDMLCLIQQNMPPSASNDIVFAVSDAVAALGRFAPHKPIVIRDTIAETTEGANKTGSAG